MKKYKIIIAFILLFSMLCLPFPVSAANENTSKADPVYGVTSVTLIRERDASWRIDIKASLSKSDADSINGETIYLFELLPYQSTSRLMDFTPAGQTKAAQNMSFSLDYEINTQRMYSKFLIARRLADSSYAILGFAHYIDNPEITAAYTYEFPKYASKKGLYVQMMSDAQELGISQTVINVPINEYIMTENTSAAVNYVYGNTTYYIKRDKLELLDYKIKQFTDVGVNCYINFILTKMTSETPETLSCLYMDTSFNDSAVLYALNTKNREAVMYYESFINFIAKRYTSPEKEYGFAGSFIIGYQINSNRFYNYMGPMTLDSYLNNYAVSYRIADTAIRSVYSNAKVYISLGNNFNTNKSAGTDNPDPTLDYSSAEIIESFAEKISISGDLPWGIAFNAYPSDPALTDYTADPECINSQETPYISMKNIDVLCEYMNQDKLLYKGSKRRITISGFGISSGEDSLSQNIQAAMYAYAYYKVLFNNDIEALIYYRHVDNVDEGNLKYGLWSAVEGQTLVPSVKKTIYEVFKNIDTGLSVDTASFALPIIGTEDWKKVIPDYNKTKLVLRHVIDMTPIVSSEIEKNNKKEIIYDFTKGSLGGFYPTDNAEYIELRTNTSLTEEKSMLYTKLYNSVINEYMGIGCHLDVPMNIKKSGSISFKIMPVAPDEAKTLNVMVRFYKNSDGVNPSVLYSGITTLEAGKWTELGFDISKMSEYTSDIDGLKIWVKSADGLYHPGEYGFWLENITMYGKSGSAIVQFILWTLLIVVIAAAVFVAALLVRGYFIRRSNAKKKAENMRRYQEYLKRKAEAENNPMMRTSGSGQQNMLRQNTGQQNITRQGTGQHNIPQQQTGQQNIPRQGTGQHNIPRQGTGQHNIPQQYTGQQNQNISRQNTQNNINSTGQHTRQNINAVNKNPQKPKARPVREIQNKNKKD